LVSTPPPPTSPPATPAAYPVNIFSNPTAETYASVGIGTNFSRSESDVPHIRYNSSGYYEVQFPGKDWDRLAVPSNVIPQYPETNNLFQAENGGGYVVIELSRLDGYVYSEIANSGEFAFGSATPDGSVPVTGEATYEGRISGGSDILQDDFLLQQKVGVPVGGSVSLSFDFGAGTLDGSMSLHASPYSGTVDIGTFSFADTVYSTGARTYSGSFDTAAQGENFFLGQFTGPNAEETIGAWALPFIYSEDGKLHQAAGAWIAKQP
jgi:hypothetical protein